MALGWSRLAHDAIHVNQFAPESWIIMAQYCDLKGLKNDSAVFVDKVGIVQCFLFPPP